MRATSCGFNSHLRHHRSLRFAQPQDHWPGMLAHLSFASVPDEDAATPGSDDIRSEAERLGQLIINERLPIRLIGGMAVWLRCPSARVPPYERHYPDLDFVASSRNRRAVTEFLQRAGYVPERMFNAIHGRDRLNFAHPTGRWTVDVVFDELRMSHKLDLRDRLNGPAPTVDLADLLLTKLQIWQINQKDLGDVICLLADHQLRINEAPRRAALPMIEDPEAIDVRRITSLCASDWGFCHTVERNLGLSRDVVGQRRPASAGFDPMEQISILLAAIDDAPKTLGWRSRARIGERVRWYETPEEVRH